MSEEGSNNEDSDAGEVNDGGPVGAERKQVTVLFCDVAEYTSRTQLMDPEDLANDIRVFQTICTGISHRYGGHISSYLGDGIMVLFGHPHAREFDPGYAIRAGLAMVAAIEKNNASAKWRNRQPMNIRVGIATSLVVVGEKAGDQRDQDELIFGEAPALAARLQSLAEANTVLTSLRTRRLVGGAFKFRNLGEHTLKGFAEPVPVWEILGETSGFNRSRNLKRAPTHFISRSRELAFLASSYQFCRDKQQARFVHVIGDAGIGKSRLIRVFQRTLWGQKLLRVRINCSPYYGSTPFRPIQEEICRWLDIDANSNEKTIQATVVQALTAMSLDTEQHRLLLSALLRPELRRAEAAAPGPEEQHYSTIRLLLEMVRWLGQQDTTMLVIEDLHWADPSTLELLDLIIRDLQDLPLLGLLTSRLGFSSPWQQSNHFTVQTLDHLDDQSSRLLVRSVFNDKPLPKNIENQLVQRSGGVPLFLEECAWHLLTQLRDRGDKQPLDETFSIPETLQDSLNARLDSLGSAKELAQIAAVFGHHFTYSHIQKIAQANHVEADNNMDILLQSGLLIMIPNVKEDRYAYRHSLFQDAAYQSLLKSRRQLYHTQIARLFQAEVADIEETEPELLAYHYSQAENAALAADMWLKAGRLALAKSAVGEALNHTEEGLNQLPKLRDRTQRRQRELALLLNLAACLTVRSGYHGHRVADTYRRCVELAESLGATEQKWSALYGYWRCMVCTGHLLDAFRLSLRLKKLSDTLDDATLRLTSSGIQAMTRMFAGKFADAETFYIESLRSADPGAGHQSGIRFGQDPYVTIQGLGAVNKLVCQDESLGRHEILQSVQAARATGHPYTIAEALRVAAMYEHIGRNMVALKYHTAEAVELSEQYGFAGLLAASRIFAAFCDAVNGHNPAALATIQHQLPIYKENYGRLFFPYFQGLLAEAYLFLQQYQDAFTEAIHVLMLNEHYRENWSQTPAMLVRAEAAARGNLAGASEIKQWYADALTTASSQGANLYRKRIEHSLARFNNPEAGGFDTTSVWVSAPATDTLHNQTSLIEDWPAAGVNQYILARDDS